MKVKHPEFGEFDTEEFYNAIGVEKQPSLFYRHEYGIMKAEDFVFHLGELVLAAMDLAYFYGHKNPLDTVRWYINPEQMKSIERKAAAQCLKDFLNLKTPKLIEKWGPGYPLLKQSRFLLPRCGRTIDGGPASGTEASGQGDRAGGAASEADGQGE
jgi:hypothetical protein